MITLCKPKCSIHALDRSRPKKTLNNKDIFALRILIRNPQRLMRECARLKYIFHKKKDKSSCTNTRNLELYNLFALLSSLLLSFANVYMMNNTEH